MAKKKYIETPEKMWALFEDYIAETKGNPITQHDFIGGKELNEIYRQKERPLTMEGFENYVANAGLNQSLDHYFGNLDNSYEEYLSICTRIKRTIRQDQIEGGMAGVYNSSITQRLNNLVDKQQHDIKQEQPLFGDNV